MKSPGTSPLLHKLPDLIPATHSIGGTADYVPRSVSPRTGLAYTILPLWARKQSLTGEEPDLDHFESYILPEGDENAAVDDLCPEIDMKPITESVRWQRL